MCNDLGAELSDTIECKKSYVIIVNGREHNVYVEHIGKNYISGRVALNKIAILVDRPGVGMAVAKVVLPQDEKNAIGPGDDLIHSEPCVVPSLDLKICISIKDISVIEDPWRLMLPDCALNQDGGVDPEILVQAIPSFGQYFVKGKGFVASPGAWNWDRKKELESVVAETLKVKNFLKIDTELDDSSSTGDE